MKFVYEFQQFHQAISSTFGSEIYQTFLSKKGPNSHFTLCKLRSIFYELQRDFVRFLKFCKANIFEFRENPCKNI